MTLTSSCQAGGFVRVPQAWLTLDISPQAKTLLMAFCAYADEKGRSYHSFEQLGEVLNRSKTSVCGYVKELRAAGLIDCTNQKYGNGYNYRLLVRIVGWADFIASWARTTQKKISAANQECPISPAEAPAVAIAHDESQAPCPAEPVTHGARAESETASQAEKLDGYSERRVRNAECKDPTGPKNQIHQNHTLRAEMRVEWTPEDEIEWRKFRSSDSDPVSQGSGTPRPDLLRKAIAKFEDLEGQFDYFPTSAMATETIDQALRSFIKRHRIEGKEDEVTRVIEQIRQSAPSAAAVTAAIGALDASWQPHWRRLPQSRQLAETIAKAIQNAQPSEPLRRRRASFQIRAMAARLWLRKVAS